jgi:hypothetical protein
MGSVYQKRRNCFFRKTKIKRPDRRGVIIGITAGSSQRTSQSQTSYDIRMPEGTNIYEAWWWVSENQWLGQVKSDNVNRDLPDCAYWWPGTLRSSAGFQETSVARMSRGDRALTHPSNKEYNDFFTLNHRISTLWTQGVETGSASVPSVSSHLSRTLEG